MSKEISEDYVKLESQQCPVCGVIHQHECDVLPNRRLKEIKPNGPNGECITGRSLCEEHDKLYKQGYVALVVATSLAGTAQPSSIEDVELTGQYLHIKADKFNEIFDKNESLQDVKLAYIEEEVFNSLVKMQTQH